MKILALSIATFASATTLFAAAHFTGTYSQNFDTLAQTGTSNPWVNDTTISGWHLYRSGSPVQAVTSYRAGTGSGTTAGFYSFGAANATDRALGGIGSSTLSGWIAASFLNSSLETFGSFNVLWNGEQWRNSMAAAQTMTFEYGFGNSFDNISWIAPGGAFNWTTPVTGGTSAQSGIGNGAGRVNDVGGTISGLTWLPGQSLWLRWAEIDDSGNDHALAIDDFRLNATPARSTASVPEAGRTVTLLMVGLAALFCSGLSRRR
jgi:hypothetical protein